MSDPHTRIPAGPFILSAIGFTCGCLIMFYGAALHDKYDYVSTYETATHISVSPGLVIVIGVFIAVLGAIGMAGALLRRKKY